MINFKITSLDNGFLAIEKPSGKTLSLKIGEVVKADIMDILPSGGIVMKIKGDTITAQSDVPLDKGSAGFFKVTGQDPDSKALKLQFMEYTDESAQGKTAANLNMSDPRGDAVSKLLKEINFLKGSEGPGKGVSPKELPLEKLESLIKALPPDINALPKNVRVQVQEILTASLKSAGQSIQARLDNLIEQLPDTIKNHPLVENLKKDLMLNVEKLLGTSLKSALQNTGVVFEAKLKALAMNEMLRLAGEGAAGPEAYPESPAQEAVIKTAAGTLPPLMEGNAERPEAGQKPPPAAAREQQLEKGIIRPEPSGGQTPRDVHGGTDNVEKQTLKHDLKAMLLELKQFIAEKGEGRAAAAHGAPDAAQLKSTQGALDGLLKDIETFQALSKTTDSFYTFLPLNWKELRDGEISFKRGQGGAEGGTAYSCRINLDLKEFGKLSVMVVMYNKDFFVSFKAERPAFKSLLDEHLEELKGSFVEQGLSLKAVTLDRDNALFGQLEKLESSERIINIKA